MEKEATVYLVDVARSMGKKHSHRQQSDLDWALKYFWDKITDIVATGRKTLQVGIVGLGTDGTSNDMQEEDSYRHISVLQPIAQILMPELRSLPKLLQPSKTDDRDVLSGIIIAVDMIMKHCRHLKYKKRLVVITNATGHIDADDIESTAEQFKNNGIELVILGIDFDDPEYGFKEEDKLEMKMDNERTLKKLVDLCDGVFGTMQEAIDELARPRIKSVRPTPTYRGQLRLGDPETYDTALCIDVERYMKTQIRRPPTASAYVVREQAGDDDQALQTVHNIYKYTVNNEEKDGDLKEIKREELAKGYEYGRTAVAISESEQNITKLETYTAYDILGFIPVENVERYMLLDNTNMIVAQKGNDKAAYALSSLVHALFELGSVAVGRLVKKDMSEPILTTLSPLIEEDIECLIENVLPFAEDVRSYRFPPLDKVLTVSGKELTEHRNLPNAMLLKSMSDFVDGMSLVHDDDELMAMDDTFSPALHTIEGAIKDRAVKPDSQAGLKKGEEFVEKYAKQPKDLQEQSKENLARLIAAADVKKVPSKAKGRRRYREAEKPISGLNVQELFRKEDRSNISPDNAVAGFKQMMEGEKNMERIKDTMQQMSAIIQEHVRTSYGEANYNRVLEELGLLREEMLGLEEPGLYNDVLRQLKKRLVAKELGGDRAKLGYLIRKHKLSLIDNEASEFSDVSTADADTFMIIKSET
ncbi:ATP-dependent DNA helicase 2 subunit 2 [Exophiala viscosa]|uniref:ATP-dependent DNA helicase II subunit 2 n=1 Tax=Exophiala viscosa TaxID=2486360 RepID=A0AAN6E2Y9_9EURO|nr:ATP-dependent DNA helicase 2 subunit 2 [Exophiala viscosa]KAI1630460.1 ATP-dependent DNA helicase 2 subunit 2 [Exophiala viscosa]